MATTQPPKPSRRKRRWGDGPTADGSSNNGDGIGDGDGESSKRKSRFSSSPPPAKGNAAVAPPPVAAAPPAAAAAADPKARAAAMKASIQARLAALKARTGAAKPPPATKSAARLPPPPPTTTIQKSIQKRPLAASSSSSNNRIDKSSKKAKVFDLDMSSTAPTRLLEKQQREEQLRLAAKPKERVNPYLAHTVVAEPPPPATAAATKSIIDGDDNNNNEAATTNSNNIQKQAAGEEILLDTRLAATSKNRLKSRPLKFVDPGTYIALGEKKRQQAQRAEESGFLSGRKVGNVVKSVGMGAGGLGGGGNVVEGLISAGDVYGASQAGKVVERTLPPRVDAPALELEDYAIAAAAPRKKVLASSSDANVEADDAAVLAAVEAATSSMPYAMEWWDAELLPGKLRKELAGEEGRAIVGRAKKQGGKVANSKKDDDRGAGGKEGGGGVSKQYRTNVAKRVRLVEKCYEQAALGQSKTHPLVQHPVPILTPAQKAAREAARNKPPTLHLTKAERKRHRKLRRAERLREQQDLQATGQLPPPEPRLTLSNYMKVLGDQAILDPSKMEATVMEQIQSRKLKHEKMNAERKLTKEQRSQKRTRKLAEDTTQSVKVALFAVRDMGHPYHRAKVDLNAQQNGITGGVLECSSEEDAGNDGGGDGDGGITLVVAEGGERAIKRYIRLMTVRMRWRGEDFYEEDEESEEELMVGEDDEEENGEGEGKKKEQRKKFNPNNECHLIWTGMALKRAFHSFMFQTAENSVVARKILEAKGVAHYWDLASGFVERRQNGGGLGFGGGGGEDEIKFRLG